MRTAALVVLATVALLVFARVVGRFYWHDIIFALNGWYVPYDLAVFLEAGDDVLAGRSPYADVATFAGNDNYVYPPALALVLAPLAAIPAAQAATIFTLLGIAAIIVGLLLFGVRDRRCILLALFFPGTHESLKYGALGSFLVLLLGLLWRYRDRAAVAGSSAAAAVVLKLFLAPFVLWLWLTRRVRAAALGAAIGAALALVSWAAIGFAGLVDYPTMLRKFSDLEAEASYSLVGIGSAFGLSGTAARVLALACGAVLLLFAARAARSATFEPLERDRRSFTLGCRPARGTLSRPAAACTKLSTGGAALFAPPAKEQVCTDVYGGPQRAIVSGTVDGRRIWVSLRRRDGCEIDRWRKLAFLLPVSLGAPS